jgi:plasmid stability protein
MRHHDPNFPMLSANLDLQTYLGLQELAQKHDRSLAAEARRVLRRYVQQHQSPSETRPTST